MKEASADSNSSIQMANPLDIKNPHLAEQCNIVADFSAWQEFNDDQASDLFESISQW